jgi:hypothetical protein
MKKSTKHQHPTVTNTLSYRKSHPNNRCSFGVPGVAGIVVFDKRLFADGKVPKTITIDCDLAAPVAKEPKATKADTPAATAAT